LYIEWSDTLNGLYAGVSDSTGANQLTLIASGDHPLNHMYIYQIERLDSTSAKFSVWDSDTGALVGSPVTRTFSGVPDSLTLALFTQSGNTTYDNVWIGNAVPEPTTAAAVMAVAFLLFPGPAR